MSTANKSPRRRAREFALQGVYQWLLSQAPLTAIESQLAEVGGFDKCDRDLFLGLLRGTISNAAELQVGFAAYIDRQINELSPIERGILLISTFELIHRPETPYRVIINEAIELANDSAYGLSGGVWSSNPDRAVEVARQIDTGMVEINGAAFNPLAPFGGRKLSGHGRELGPYGIEDFLTLKSLYI